MAEHKIATARTRANLTGPGHAAKADLPRVLVVGGPPLPELAFAQVQQVPQVPTSALVLAQLCLGSGAAVWVLDERCFHHKKPQQLKFLAAQEPPARWLMACEKTGQLAVAPLIEARACGVMEWRDLPAQLAPALITLQKGQLWFPRQVLEAMYSNLMTRLQLAARPAEKDLTPRETAVLTCMRRGLANKAIAVHLGVSVNTVKKQVASVMAKRAVSRRRQLAL